MGSAHAAAQLLLAGEKEIAHERMAHLAECEGCQRSAMQLRSFLTDIEHEIRALLPDEPVERKAAALVALEERIAVEETAAANVVEFPVFRWREYASYATAAAAMFAVGVAYWNNTPTVEQPASPPAIVAEI